MIYFFKRIITFVCNKVGSSTDSFSVVIYGVFSALLSVSVCQPVKAQQPRLQIITQFSRDTILPGDTIDLQIQVVTREKPIQGVVPDSFHLFILEQTGALDILSTGKWSKTNLVSGKVLSQIDNSLGWDTTYINQTTVLENTFSLVLWRTGTYAPPGLRFLFSNPADTFYLPESEHEAQLVVVAPAIPAELIETDDSLNLATIKDIIKEPTRINDYLRVALYYLLTSGLLAGIYLLFFYHPPRESQPEIIKDFEPHWVALSLIDHLNKKGMPPSYPIKDWYSNLSFILRAYLHQNFHIQALEITSSETIAQMRATGIGAKHISEVRSFLERADAVKFAKALPEEAAHQESMHALVQFIRETAPADGDSKDAAPLLVDKNAEGIPKTHQLVQQTVSPIKRFLAAAIDVLPALLVFAVLSFILPDRPFENPVFDEFTFHKGILPVLLTFCLSLAGSSLLISQTGKTPGMLLIKARMITPASPKISIKQAMLRFLLKWLSVSVFSVFNLVPFCKKTNRNLLYDPLTDIRLVEVKMIPFDAEHYEKQTLST